MKRSIVGVIFVLVCCVTLVGNSYGAFYNGHEYLLTSSSGTWLDAEAQAVALGGHLVTINDVAEQNWVTATFTEPYWIGFTDQALEGTWVWISGEPVTYTKWNAGEPNNAGGIEDWAEMTTLNNWNDLSLSYSRYGIIEIPDDGPITTPEPATMLLIGLGLVGLAGVRRFKK